jgi:endonuclease-3
VILGSAFGKTEGVVVDTHVARLSHRLGLTRQREPKKSEQDLMRLVPREDWTIFSHWLIAHGRARCSARKPDCENCELADLCPKIGVKGK